MDNSASHPEPIQPPLKLLRPEDEARKALAELIGREAARRFLAGRTERKSMAATAQPDAGRAK